MKKFALLIAAFVLLANSMIGQPYAASAVKWSYPNSPIASVGSTTTGTYPATPTTGIDTSTWTSVLVSMTSATATTWTMTYDQSLDGVNWVTAVTVAASSGTGELWACPAAPKSRFRITSHTGGTLTATIVGRFVAPDPLSGGCKQIATAANAFGALSVTSLTDSGLTATRIPYSGSGGLLADASGFTYAAGAVAIPTSVATTRFLSTGTAPTVANVGADSCGTTAASIVGKDQAHVITVGATSGTECRVTFNVAFANAPVCVAVGSVATDLTLVTTTTYVNITGTLTAAEKIHVHCLGY